MRALLTVFALCAVAAQVEMDACLYAPGGPFVNVWINELRYMDSSLSPQRFVEVATLRVANVDPATVFLVVTTPAGAVAGSVPLAACVSHPDVRLTSTHANDPLVDFFICNEATAGYGYAAFGSFSGSGGLALVQLANATTSALRVLQYIGVGSVGLTAASRNAAAYAGALPCPLPAAAQYSPGDDPLKSTQLLNAGDGPGSTFNTGLGLSVGAANFSAVLALVDTSRLRWQKGLSATYGERNMAQSATETAHCQDFVAAPPGLFDAAVAAALPLPPSGAALPSAPSVAALAAAAGTDRACVLGLFEAWGACSATCGNASGAQERSRPVLLAAAGAGAACAPALAPARLETRACFAADAGAGGAANGSLPCAQCANGARDGAESDTDCGGSLGADASLPSNATLAAAVAALFGAGGAGALPLPAAPAGLAAPACARCGAGRACAAHSDCDRASGLLCLPALRVCSPFWLAGAALWVEVNVTAGGASPRELSTAAGARALRYGVAAFAATAGGAGAAAAGAGVNATIAGFAFAPAGAARRALGLRGPASEAPDVGARALAAAGDLVTARVLVAAASPAEAAAMAANLGSGGTAAAAALQTQLRAAAPLVHDVVVSAPRVVGAAAAGTGELPVPAPAPVVAPAPVPGALGAPAVGLAPGTIAGIVVGSIAGAVLLAGLAVEVARRRAEARRAGARSRAERAAAAAASADAAAAADAAGAAAAARAAAATAAAALTLRSAAREKSAFQPTRAGAGADGAEDAGGAGGGEEERGGASGEGASESKAAEERGPGVVMLGDVEVALPSPPSPALPSPTASVASAVVAAMAESAGAGKSPTSAQRDEASAGDAASLPGAAGDGSPGSSSPARSASSPGSPGESN